MAFSSHVFSVFCPLDSIVPAQEGVLADFSFIELKAGRRSALAILPFTGPGWYHRVASEFLLHHGLITWRDIIFSLSATGKLPPKCLSEPLKIMEEAWGDEEHLAKLSVNMMIGLWASDAQCLYHVKTSQDAVDGMGAWAKRMVKFEGGELCDFIFRTKVLGNSSMRPLHDQIMSTEHTRIAQILWRIKALKVPQRCIKDIKTDCVILQGFPQKRKADLMDLGKLTFKDLPNLRRRFHDFRQPDKSQTFLDCYIEMGISPELTPQEVFRMGAGKPLQGSYQQPWREARKPAPREPWKDLTEDEAMIAINEGMSLLVVGSPGTGKTHWWSSLRLVMRKPLP